MKTIWKFKLKIDDVQRVEMPLTSKILSIQTQRDKPYMWCLVNPEDEKAFREIIINGTGHPVEHDARYIGTFQIMDGGLVFHVFDNGYK